MPVQLKIGTFCDSSNAYGVTWFSGSRINDVATVAHELGHNWNAKHCNSNPPCYIMCSWAGGCNQNSKLFGPQAVNEINVFRSARGCLSRFTPDIPSLTSIGPNTAENFNWNALYPGGGQLITLTGSHLDDATEIIVGNKNINYENVVGKSFSQLSFNLPNAIPIGNNAVTVSNISGSSNSLNLNITAVSPSILAVSNFFHNSGTTVNYQTYTQAFWNALYVFSMSNQPSVVPGVLSLELGNNFTESVFVTTIQADAGGLADLPLFIGISGLGTVTGYWQVITYDPFNITLPLEVTNQAIVIYSL